MTPNPLQPVSSTGAPAPMGQPSAGSSRFAPLDPWRVLRQHMWLLIATGVVGVVVGVAMYFPLLRYTPEYTSEAQVSVSAPLENVYATGQDATGPGGQMETLQAFMQNQVFRILSEDVLNATLNHPYVRGTQWFHPFRLGENEANIIQARRALESALSVQAIQKTTLIRVRFSGRHPQDVKVILDTLLTVYRQIMAQDSESQTADLRRAFVSEVQIATDQLSTAQEDLKRFAKENDLSSLQARGHDAQIEYQALSEQDAKLKLELQQVHQIYQGLMAAQQEGRNTASPQDVAEAEADQAIAIRKEKLRSLREERQVYLHRFGENHRHVLDIDRQILAVEQEIKREMDRILRERQEVKIEQAKGAVAGLEAQLVSLKAELDKSRERVRDLELKAQDYQQIGERAEQAKIRRENAQKLLDEIRLKTARPDYVRVRALPATDPKLTSPSLLITVAGSTMLALMIVGGLVFLKELMDQRIKSPADVRLLPRAELLGVLPDATEDPSGSARIEGVVLKDPAGLMAESFRQARTVLLSRMDRRGFKSLLVAGAQAQAGTSTVVSNLAVSTAFLGRRVLILDVNFRRPAQHRLFAAQATPGLVEVLTNQVSVEQAIVRPEGTTVDLLPAGACRDASPELLEGPAFRNLLGQLSSQYDLVLIDAPPVLLTSECQVLAKQVDAVALVVRAMSDQRGMVARMIRQLEGQHAEVLGVILNGVRSSAGGYFRKNYEEFYRYRQLTQDGSARVKSVTASVKK